MPLDIIDTQEEEQIISDSSTNKQYDICVHDIHMSDSLTDPELKNRGKVLKFIEDYTIANPERARNLRFAILKVSICYPGSANYQNSTFIVNKLLQEDPSLANAYLSDGSFLLLHAAVNGNAYLILMDILLKHGADPKLISHENENSSNIAKPETNIAQTAIIFRGRIQEEALARVLAYYSDQEIKDLIIWARQNVNQNDIENFGAVLTYLRKMQNMAAALQQQKLLAFYGLTTRQDQNTLIFKFAKRDGGHDIGRRIGKMLFSASSAGPFKGEKYPMYLQNLWSYYHTGLFSVLNNLEKSIGEASTEKDKTIARERFESFNQMLDARCSTRPGLR